MGAFGELLGFEGRINRLGYLWRMMLVWLALAALVTVGGGALVFIVKPMGFGDYQTGVQWMTIGAVLLALWASLALASRRLRDMGLEPVYFVPLYAALWVVNSVLVAPMSQLQPERFGLLEIGWGGLQLLTAIPLLFWPGRAAPAPVVAIYEPSEPTTQMDWRANG
jgi:uncharacterized membrane protein YhaH (DUF805 family)